MRSSKMYKRILRFFYGDNANPHPAHPILVLFGSIAAFIVLPLESPIAGVSDYMPSFTIIVITALAAGTLISFENKE